MSVPEDPIYILSDADDTLFLGTTTTPNPDIEGIPPVGLPVRPLPHMVNKRVH